MITIFSLKHHPLISNKLFQVQVIKKIIILLKAIIIQKKT